MSLIHSTDLGKEIPQASENRVRFCQGFMANRISRQAFAPSSIISSGPWASCAFSSLGVHHRKSPTSSCRAGVPVRVSPVMFHTAKTRSLYGVHNNIEKQQENEDDWTDTAVLNHVEPSIWVWLRSVLKRALNSPLARLVICVQSL